MKIYLKAKTAIYSMAFDRSIAINHLKKPAKTLMRHMIKCIVYGNTTGNYDHWINEISDYLEIANDVRMSPKNKKPDWDMFNTYLLGELGDTELDAKVIIAEFSKDNEKAIRMGKKHYPRFDPTYDMAVRLSKAVGRLKQLIRPILCNKNNYTKDGFAALVREALSV